MVVAGIATVPSRINEVKRTIESLLPQVDIVFVALNNFTAIPTHLAQKGVFMKVTQGSDEQKFLALDYLHTKPDIFLTCDDDLIYPPNYVEVIKEKLALYDITSFHGRNFNHFPIHSYYKSAGSKYRCLDKVSIDVPVQVGGTGCMAFKPANFHVTLNDFPSKYMADVHLAVKAMKEGKRIMCIAHESGWIKYQQVQNTIYDRFKDSDFEQTQRMNQAFELYSKLAA